MSFRMPIHTNTPDIGTGYPIDGEWEIVVPIARSNEVLNPSFETNLTGYTAGAGSLVRSTTKQYHGAYSAAYTPSSASNDGFYYSPLSTVSGQFRAISCKLNGQPNIPYALTLATSGGVDLVTFPFKGNGRWQWVWLYWLETSTTTRRIYFRKNGSSDTHVFYVDGVQSEVINTGEFVSTYIDGDQQGFLPNQQPPAYNWHGIPHASMSSRILATRAGGYVISFKRYGFLLLAIIGLGLPAPLNIKTEYAQLDGGIPIFTRKPTDQFSIVGNMSEGTYRSLRASRSSLGQFMDRDASALDQPMLLRYRHTDSCDNPQSDTVVIPCKYVSGWEGQSTNHQGQVITMTFEQYLPAITTDGEAGSALSMQSSLLNADYFLKRSPAGVWSVPGGGTASVTRLFEGSDGTIYIGGGFTNWNGIAAADGIVKYNPTTGVYTACSTGMVGGGVGVMAELPNGRIVMGGGFTSAGGVANTARIAVYDPVADTFSALGTGASSNSVFALVVDSTGGIYAGGDYGLMGGVANTVRIAYWNGSAWTALGTGANGTVFALVIGLDRNLYLTGAFTTLNGVACNQIGKWNGSAFTAMSTGVNGSGGRALASGPNGLIYVGGLFTAAGGVSGTNRIASWNGVTFLSMGGGLGDDVTGLSVDAQGVVLATGQFGQTTSAGGAFFPDGAARFNGSSWTTIGVDAPATNTIGAGLIARDGTMYIAYGVAGTATVESTTSVVNPGTARAYPTVVINGPSSGSARVYSLLNYTTNKFIYMNLMTNAGETVTLVFQPDNLSFTSSFAGDVSSSILNGSDTSDFFLQKGTNSIAGFAASSTITATMSYHPAFVSLDDVN